MEKRIQRRICANHTDNTIGAFSADIPALLARIYQARDVHSDGELNRSLSALLPYHSFKGMPQAAVLLSQTIQAQKRILIVGDFDADGATSTAVAVRALKSFGAQQVDFLVPNRFTYGYGLSEAIVEVAAETKQPDLIITVDNGIASIGGVARANALGIQVLVTDHHLPGQTLPEAAVIVNPNQPGCEFPSKCIAGVGVIFYVMCAVRAQLLAEGWFAQQQLELPNMAHLLDIVALGTVADVVRLDQNNRVLVHHGLARIRSGKMAPGIRALLQVAQRDYTQCVASDLGFALGPRLNAAGRLDDMSIGIQCLLANDDKQALGYALQLQKLNRERRDIEADMQKTALAIVDGWRAQGEGWYGLSLFDESWHQGVIGLVASRIKEKEHRPVIAFAKAEQPGWIKGSARSIPGVHIRDVLDRLATQSPGLIEKFGGHAMAAGLTLHESQLENFRKLFNQTILESVDPHLLNPCIETDGELTELEFSLATARMLREGGPWGQGFPEPCFDGRFELLDQRLIGEKHIRVTVRIPGGQRVFPGVLFNADLSLWPNYRVQEVELVYRLDINLYQEQQTLQLLIEQMRPAPNLGAP